MIAITGGGTGGHLAIVKAFKEELVKRDIGVVYIGSTNGQDREWFEKDKDFVKTYFLKSGGVVNKSGINKLLAVKNIIFLSLRAKSILKNHNIKGVISVGGYSAAPASFGAILNKTPLFIHEQNAHIGKLNQILKPFSKRLFCSFLPPYDPYPVREEFFKLQRVRKELKQVIFLGGSQGATQINEIAMNLAPKLNEKGIKIVHQTGKKDFIKVKEFYKQKNIKADVFDFSTNLAQKMAKSDLAISRSGASSVWELISNALPSILIPYPYAAQNHQEKNAIFAESKGVAKLYNKDIDIFSLPLEDMSKNCLKLAKRDGAKIIIDEILSSI
jgi:UDP-N-acetylglucosamine--N-acetylmuramyl-(pentapeptide) pyrophosphoryl-undecaprenol N-acetylglucosamine transferase